MRWMAISVIHPIQTSFSVSEYMQSRIYLNSVIFTIGKMLCLHKWFTVFLVILTNWTFLQTFLQYSNAGSNNILHVLTEAENFLNTQHYNFLPVPVHDQILYYASSFMWSGCWSRKKGEAFSGPSHRTLKSQAPICASYGLTPPMLPLQAALGFSGLIIQMPSFSATWVSKLSSRYHYIALFN